MSSFSLSSKDIKHPKCERCEKEVPFEDKFVVDRLTIHKSCFKCAICDKALSVGACSLERGLSRYGPLWFCWEHMMTPPGEKEQLIVQKGYKIKFGDKK
uniref:LIM zinc-binding domain-containing protein n=1 Tax=Globodera rostochiensis TaxID=31243 RepID=A0A914HYC4_GLORO